MTPQCTRHPPCVITVDAEKVTDPVQLGKILWLVDIKGIIHNVWCVLPLLRPGLLCLGWCSIIVCMYNITDKISHHAICVYWLLQTRTQGGGLGRSVYVATHNTHHTKQAQSQEKSFVFTFHYVCFEEAFVQSKVHWTMKMQTKCIQNHASTSKSSN